jgi:uncharacterized protein
MWHKIAAYIIKLRIILLVILLLATGVMGYFASQVKLSYDFISAVPTDNPKYIDYQNFKKTFGEDGNLMVIGVQTTDFFSSAFFKEYVQLSRELAKVPAVENVLSIPAAINLKKDTVTQRLKTVPLVDSTADATGNYDSVKYLFSNLVFYKNFLYNPDSNTYMMALRINKDVLNSKDRSVVISKILQLCNDFCDRQHVTMHYSGLPLIRTEMAMRVKSEMRLFLILSFVLTAAILVLFFHSASAVISSMLVVAMGVVWSIGTIVLLGYKITLLTALIPPLVVVIGIPNCVYLINKFHIEFDKTRNKFKSLIRMVDRMGIVTFFTNLTAAIGFVVFYFTKSTLLKEFGLVAGINIIALFVISLIFIPAFFSFLPDPKVKHFRYLERKWIHQLLTKISDWVFTHRVWIYGFTLLVCAFSVVGLMKLTNETHIVDDLPKSDRVYQDLKFFEKNFKGVMPLEIVIDTKKKNGVLSIDALNRIDQLVQYLQTIDGIGHPLAITEGIKFANQAYFGGDSSNYALPANLFEAAFIMPYLRPAKSDKKALFNKLLNSFIDSNKQKAHIMVNMADVGSVRLPVLLDSFIRPQVNAIFDTSKYQVTLTGTSITFLEGSKFIVNSLRDSLILAFLIIFGCMVLLFRSWRILLISIAVNVIPLIITAGLMGWVGIRIKPSTVLVFSVALGITIDVTIRFLVNFKQELTRHDDSIADTVHRTIHDTGLSIIYTSLILIAGFSVFMLSHFDGTKSLGNLTSLTLFLAMITNLTLLPALLLWMEKVYLKKEKAASFLLEED